MLLQKILRGTVEAKLNLIGEILYEECSSRCGGVTSRKAGERRKGRREKEIEDLVADRRQLRRCWRKTEEGERDGLKNCPGVLQLLWILMRTAWTKQTIPSQWQREVAVFILKEQNSKTIEQF